jgi:hypothetical protein
MGEHSGKCDLPIMDIVSNWERLFRPVENMFDLHTRATKCLVEWQVHFRPGYERCSQSDRCS